MMRLEDFFKTRIEAPVCIVTSLGLTKDVPSRNRTILIGLIRDMEKYYGNKI